MNLEILVNDIWVRATWCIFRSWCGQRRVNDKEFHGKVFYFGTGKVRFSRS